MNSRTVFLVAIIALFAVLCITSPKLIAASGVGFAMAIPVKDAAAAAAKFAANGSRAGADYTAGVTGAGSRWQENASKAEDNFAAGVQAAIGRKSFSKGVQESGGNHYEERARSVGAQRFPQGITAAKDAYASGVAPYLSVIAGANLPPRGPKGDPRNQERSNMIATLLRKKKVGG